VSTLIVGCGQRLFGRWLMNAVQWRNVDLSPKELNGARQAEKVLMARLKRDWQHAKLAQS